MDLYKVVIKPSAVKELNAVSSKKNRRNLVRKIQGLADEPRPAGARKLSGRELYRLRHGKYRVIYGIEDAELVVLVIKVGHRRDVYRAL